MNPLKSAILKAQWAHRHLHILYDEVDRVLGKKDQTFVGEYDSEKSAYVFRRELTDAQRTHWALIVGDIVVNLRASLDHIAYQLALQTTKDHEILKNIYFPILDKRNDGTFSFQTRGRSADKEVSAVCHTSI